jgi:hypothetical protein
VISGVHLTLLVGPVVAVPAPKIVMDALQSVEVTSSDGSAGESGFQLTFAFSNRSPLITLFLIAGAQTPMLRVIIIATFNAMPHVLMDGVMTHHEIQPGSGDNPSTLTVTGKDLTKVMSLVDYGGLPYPAMPIEARIALIVAKYAAFGMIPLVIPTFATDVPLPVDRIPAHEGTDLEYIEQLANDVGYVFYIEPGPAPGTNLAYFGPQIKVGVPQPALNIDMDAHTNVESLSFRLESAETTLPVLMIYNQQTRFSIPIPIPSINPLQPPLGLIPAPITNVEVLRDTARMTVARALMRGLAVGGRSQDFVKGSGSLDVLRYGRVLKARQLVGVRGAGQAFDGLHYVESVTTTLKRGEFKQSFSLSRNGLVSITPVVPA